jgi:hypothetical protein
MNVRRSPCPEEPAETGRQHIDHELLLPGVAKESNGGALPVDLIALRSESCAALMCTPRYRYRETVDQVHRDVRKYKAIEDFHRTRLVEAIASGDEYTQRVGPLTIAYCGVMRKALQAASGVPQSLLYVQASDLHIERLQFEIDWYSAQGDELPAGLKRRALQRALDSRSEREYLLRMQQAGQAGIA